MIGVMTRKRAKPIDASHDPLTGLAQREAASARLHEWLGEDLLVHGLLIGIRRFDAVNTTFGASAGDAVLAEFASRLKHFAAGELDGAWLAARINGSQFLLLGTEACSRERWQVLAAQVLDFCSRPVITASGTVRLSLRGALLRGLNREDPDSMLDRLGQALGQVMVQPGRRLLWADGEAAKAGRNAAQLETDLLRALDSDAIEVVYQPQFACADDRLTGAEALARWNHPVLGRIGAGTLFAVAERCDHVPQLSRHIARKAIQGAKRWPMDLRLSLNVTANDLASQTFADQFLAMTREEGFAPWRLTVEVTEQVLLGEVKQAATQLAQLAAAGARIALDDFGAGFCNFRYLKLLPLHFLKLDRSMIEGVVGSARDLAVLRAIVAMANALELKVIVEGVESEAQRALASAEGCAAYQGFLRAKPMSGDAFLNFARLT